MFVDEFKKYNPLYHFTNFESAVKILASKKLRYGKMDKLNDPNESFRQIYYMADNVSPESYEMIDAIRKELEHYQQISFSCDSVLLRGFNLLNMWGNYADKGNGVCLVFDQDELTKGLQEKCFGNIEYINNYDPSISFIENSLDDVVDYVSNNIKSIFFKKSMEWQYEQEFRIVQRFDSIGDNYLDLNKCWDNVLKCVIFINANDVKNEETIFGSSSYKAISQLVPKDCKLLQKAKDLEDGKDILYNSKEVYYGEINDNKNIDT